VESYPFAVIPGRGELSDHRDFGIPAIAKRLAENDWDVELLYTTLGSTYSNLDSVQVDPMSDEVYIAVYSPFGDPQYGSDPMLLLGHYDGSWQVDPLQIADVAGHQSITLLPSGDVAMTYLSSDEYRLGYAEINNGTVSLLCLSDSTYSGFHSSIGIKQDGTPTVFSVGTQRGQLLQNTLINGEFNERNIFFALSDVSALDRNTVSIAKLDGNFEIGWVQPDFQLGMARAGM